MTAVKNIGRQDIEDSILSGKLSGSLKYSIATTVDMWDEFIDSTLDCSSELLDGLYESCTYSLQLVASNGRHKKIRGLVHKILKHPNASEDLLRKILEEPLLELRKVKQLDFTDPGMLPWFFKLPAMEAALQNRHCPQKYLMQACGSPFVSLRRIAVMHPDCPEDGHIVAALLGI